VSEDAVVRDLLFVFQGIQGQFITFSLLEDAYILQPNLAFSPSNKKLIFELCELGWLFKKVFEWLNRHLESHGNVNLVT